MKILIAEDAPVDAIILRNIIEHDGHVPIVVSNGRAALAALDEHPDIAAVVADMRMPELDGLALFGAMRERPELADIPMIFVSAVAEATAVRQALALGSNGYVLKPINEPSRILDLLYRALGGVNQILDDEEDVGRRTGLTPAAVRALRQQLVTEASAALEALDAPAPEMRDRLETLRRLGVTAGARRLAAALRAVDEGASDGMARLRRQLRAVLDALEGVATEAR
jgi:CheY-like chemotaxis protein